MFFNYLIFIIFINDLIKKNKLKLYCDWFGLIGYNYCIFDSLKNCVFFVGLE